MTTGSPEYLCWHHFSPKNWPLLTETNGFLVSGSSPKVRVPVTEPKGSLNKLRSHTQTPSLEATQWKEEMQDSHFLAICLRAERSWQGDVAIKVIFFLVMDSLL